MMAFDYKVKTQCFIVIVICLLVIGTSGLFNSFCIDTAGWVSRPLLSCAEWSHPTVPAVF